MVIPSRTTLYLSAALLLSLFAIGYNYQRGERFKAEAVSAQRELAAAIDAAQNNGTIAKACDTAVGKLLETSKDQHNALMAASQRMQEMAEEIVSLRTKLRPIEDSDREKPDCAKLLQVDFAAVCPGMGSGMRERAANSLPRPRSAGAGTGQATG